MVTPEIERLLEKLVKDVELAVHALYRGEVRQNTQKARTSHLLSDAKTALGVAVGRPTPPPGIAAVAPPVPVSASFGRPTTAIPGGPLFTGQTGAVPAMTGPRPTVSTPKNTGVVPGWSVQDRDAVVKCINAWLPMGGPASTPSETKCIPAGKMLQPTWGERELAREAVRKLAQG